jgi:hypothetical protein
MLCTGLTERGIVRLAVKARLCNRLHRRDNLRAVRRTCYGLLPAGSRDRRRREPPTSMNCKREWNGIATAIGCQADDKRPLCLTS